MPLGTRWVLENIELKGFAQRTLAIACFRRMLFANRPLHWTGLQTAITLGISVAPEGLKFFDYLFMTQIKDLCSSLVYFPRPIKARFWDQQKVAFIQPSILQFFFAGREDRLGTTAPHPAPPLSLRPLTGPWSILFDTRAMHCKNALNCIRLLGGKLDSLIDCDSFNYYAIHNLDKHLVASEELLEPPSEPLVVLQCMLHKDPEYLRSFLRMRLSDFL